MTNEERKKLLEMGHSQHVTASSITLLIVKEVDEILYGNEDKYKGNMTTAAVAALNESSSRYINSDSKWMLSCTTITGHFFSIFMFIFHKTEVQKVILRCLTGLNLDWFKSYDTKHKYFHFFLFCNFVQKQTFASFAFFVLLCFLS